MIGSRRLGSVEPEIRKTDLAAPPSYASPFGKLCPQEVFLWLSGFVPETLARVGVSSMWQASAWDSVLVSSGFGVEELAGRRWVHSCCGRRRFRITPRPLWKQVSQRVVNVMLHRRLPKRPSLLPGRESLSTCSSDSTALGVPSMSLITFSMMVVRAIATGSPRRSSFQFQLVRRKRCTPPATATRRRPADHRRSRASKFPISQRVPLDDTPCQQRSHRPGEGRERKYNASG